MTNPQPAESVDLTVSPAASPAATHPHYVAAPYGRRVLAYLVDFGIVMGAVLVAAAIGAAIGFVGLFILLVIGALFGALVSLVLALGATVWYSGLKGTERGTVGMRVMQIRVIDVQTLAPIGVWKALLRALVFGVLAVFFAWLSPKFDSTGRLQGWHDKLLGTWVVDARYLEPHHTHTPEPTLDSHRP